MPGVSEPQRPATPAPAVAPAIPWVLLHTKARQEKAVAEHLDGLGLEGYLPLIQIRRTYGHRKRESLVPMFPSYVFVRCAAESRWRLQDSGRVAQILEIADQRRFIDEMDHIRRAIAADVVFDPHPYLAVGRRVRVRVGPLRGVEGIVELKPRVDRLVLQVHTLGQATSVEIDAATLEALD